MALGYETTTDLPFPSFSSSPLANESLKDGLPVEPNRFSLISLLPRSILYDSGIPQSQLTYLWPIVKSVFCPRSALMSETQWTVLFQSVPTHALEPLDHLPIPTPSKKD